MTREVEKIEVKELTEEEKVLKEKFNRMFQTFRDLNLIDLTYSKDSVVSVFTKEELKRYLNDVSTPSNQQNLRAISRALYLTSPHYRSLINFYSTLYNFDYVVEGYDVPDYSKVNRDRYARAYFRALANVERMNIKHESLKIRVNAYIDGVFYGYARVSKDGFYIQHFDPRNCMVSFINYETGTFGYSFDFSIFRSNESLLENYPEEF